MVPPVPQVSATSDARRAVLRWHEVMTTTTIRVSEPRELLAYLPYRLGFRPRRSAVMISLRGERGRLGLVARVDLDDLAHRESGPAVASGLATHLWRDGAEQAVLVIYDEHVRDAATWSPTVIDAVQHALDPLETMVGPTQVWVVDEDRYFSFDCPDATCCPPQGRPLGDLDSTHVSAQMVFAGASIAEHRGAVTEVVPAAKTSRYNVRRVARRWAERRIEAEAGDRLPEWQLASLRAWHAAVDLRLQGREVPPRLLGRLDTALEDTFVRDAVIMSVATGAEQTELALRDDRALAGRHMSAAFGSIFDTDGEAPDRDRLDAWAGVLRAVLAHSRGGVHAPAATLLVVLAWWSGDGATANGWLAKAIDADPGYRLATLLGATLEAALPPGWVRRAAARDATLR